MNLVKVTAVAQSLITCGSNAAYLLNKMGYTFANQNLSHIRLKEVPLQGAIFLRANLTGSIFERINITGADLQFANL